MEDRIKRNRKIFDEIFKNALFIIAIVAITCSFPREAKYQYQFEVGKPWQYDLLTATYDAPIYKTKAELKADRDAILNKNVPYYNYNSAVESEQIKNMETYVMHVSLSQDGIKDENKKEHAPYAAYLKSQLHEIYSKGLLKNNDFAELETKNTEHIVVLNGGIGRNHTTEDIYSVSKALQKILNNIPSDLSSTKLRGFGIENYLKSNLQYNADITNKIKTDELNNVSTTSGMVQAGERIIDKGEIITEQKFKILDSLRKDYESRKEYSSEQNNWLISGQALLVTFLISLFYLYTRLFRKKFYNSKRYIVLLLILISGFTILTALIVRKYSEEYFIFFIPYALLPIILSTFFDTRTALFAHFITILLSALMVHSQFEFILLQITAGMVTIYSLKDLTQRSQLIQSALIIFASYCIFYLGYGLTIYKINWEMLLSFLINGVMLLFAYPLIYIIEKTFGFISNVTLIELTNTNNPLLRRLSESAPGTFQHSMQVSNLAAEIAVKIGANPLLARTGALYHDIGKIQNPAFFTENQSKGNNPHDKLSPEGSAQIIMRHVSDGKTLAKEYSLPRSVIEFIETHHGKNKTKYFYNIWINQHPNDTVDESLFTYPGPNPYTKELGILMICDSVEAASRGMTEYTDESINQLVENIVDELVYGHFLDNAPLTLKQITLTKSVLKEKLKNIYHTRIAYPEINKQ
ncbi:MAG: HDIG domain-containing protein [Bacteroidia bacterium]|nr:HDIG domain-containing protein [Bacteroidia bacterium]